MGKSRPPFLGRFSGRRAVNAAAGPVRSSLESEKVSIKVRIKEILK